MTKKKTPARAKADAIPIGKALRTLRESRKLTLQHVSQGVGLATQIQLSKIERGAVIPSLATTLRLASFYQVSLDYLLGRPTVGFNPEEPFWRAVHELLAGLAPQDRERVRKSIEFTVNNL